LEHYPKIVSPQWAKYEPIIGMKYKRAESAVGSFCTFLHAEDVMIKEPIVFFKRIMGQIERGKMEDSLLGYFELFTIQYREGERLQEVLNQEQMEHVSAINNIFFNLRRFGVKGNVDWSKVHVNEHELLFRDHQVFMTAITSFLESVPKEPIDVMNRIGTIAESGWAGAWDED